jgi:hypothetical protein
MRIFLQKEWSLVGHERDVEKGRVMKVDESAST